MDSSPRHYVLSRYFQAMDVLDSEASEDEAARKEVPIKRPPSHEANQELVQKQERYRSILTQAAGSDEVVRQKWRQWEKSILQLALDEVGAFVESLDCTYGGLG